MYQILSVEATVVGMRTRIPFRYGIAEMTSAPHVAVRLVLDLEGKQAVGIASEHLPPKWFTKNPTSTFAEDLPGLVGSVLNAVELAKALPGAETPFALWRTLDDAQREWAKQNSVPGLLAGLGVSLVERAMIDASCRLHGVNFADAVHEGVLGLDLGLVHPELSGHSYGDLVSRNPERRIAIRHTLGLSDPLTSADAYDDPRDGLPVVLEDVIDRYGVTHFKLKTAGDAAGDAERIAGFIDVTSAHGIKNPLVTIDGNESFRTAEHFAQWWHSLAADPRLDRLLSESLLAIEQPFHRDIALSDEVGELLRGDASLPPVIIDESDAVLESVRDAMDLGYAGGTYKGCKGVFRGLANAALIAARGADRRTVLTAEDLSTVGPLTLLQDLATVSVLGLSHVERNGHHYFGQLAPLAETVSRDVLAAHGDLFEEIAGQARLRIIGGEVDVTSILSAPFGCSPQWAVEKLTPLSAESARAAVDPVAAAATPSATARA